MLVTEDWKTKVDFLRAQHASEASWDAEGRLVSIKLDPFTPASDSSDDPDTQHANKESPEAMRRRIALRAVGGLRRRGDRQ